MTFKLTVRQVYESVEPIQELLSTPMPANIGFRITRITKKLDEVINTSQETITERRKNFFGEGGNPEEADEKALSAWNDELGTLLDEEVEIEGDVISIKYLGTVDIAPRVFLALDWLIKE